VRERVVIVVAAYSTRVGIAGERLFIEWGGGPCIIIYLKLKPKISPLGMVFMDTYH